MITAPEALIRLQEGNQRFVAEQRAGSTLASASRRKEVALSQEPFAIILGCSDPRVPAEIIFDQGLGGLFVIRIAGNIVAPSQIGSIEFAAERFHTRLVVVLGHSMCGAILAALEDLENPGQESSPNLRSIVGRVRPAIENLMPVTRWPDRDELTRQAVRANIGASVNHLRHGSDILENLIQDDGLLIVGAEYCLETGLVEFI